MNLGIGRISLVVTLALFLTAGCAGKDSAPEDAAAETDVMTGEMEPMADEGLTGTGGDLTLPTVYFDFDRATLKSEGRTALQGAADSMQGNANAQITIEGHCDERGSIEYNLALGERRAQAVKDYLSQLGVPSNQLSTISYGEERPAEMGSDEMAWSRNRRAEMVSGP